MEKEKTKMVKIEKDTHLYISDILCWLSGYLAGKGDDFKDYSLLNDACDKLRALNTQLKGDE